MSKIFFFFVKTKSKVIVCHKYLFFYVHEAITISLISICGNIRMGVAADVNIIESDKKCRQFTENFFKELSLLKQNGNYEAENI